MKKVENSFTVTGFVSKDAEIRQFTSASVARFPLAVGRSNGKEGKEAVRVSAFMNMEAWRKNESTSFELLKKGTMLTVEGFFRPEEWTDRDGVKHNRIMMVANKFYAPVEKEEGKKVEKTGVKRKVKKTKDA